MAWQGWGHPFPIAPIRDRYLTPYAGVSFDLAPYEVGVNAQALTANTTLPADARVLVGMATEGAPRATPLLTRPTYRVVPLDDRRPDALRLSPGGEAVFSTFESDADTTLLPWLRRGDPLILNAALARFSAQLRRPGEAI